MSVRVYLASSIGDLRTAANAGFPAGGERFLAADDDEESEYAALEAAARASADAGAERRVVVVAEVADPDAAFGLDRVVAVHADTSADHGPDDDLGWYATQEIADLIG